MRITGANPQAHTEEFQGSQTLTPGFRSFGDRALYAIYALALAVAISMWFIAIPAGLRLDETGSYWQIYRGFSEILSRQGLSFPAYSYILWFSTKIIGTSEIALRIPSTLAMLAAVYVLYLIARQLFERDIALITAIVFCLHPIVLYESIDARPYAFAALATNIAIYILLRLRRNNSDWLAALFGLSAACIVWFQFLFVDILPALVLCFFAVKTCERKILWRQFGVALAAFTLAYLPVIPTMLFVFRTSKTHVYDPPPSLSDLAWTLAPALHLIVFCSVGFGAFLIFAARRRRYSFSRFDRRRFVFCASLALIPILILYCVSVGTSAHAFATCHRMDAIPGIALCWAFVLSRFSSRNFRLLFSVTLVTAAIAAAFMPSNLLLTKKHGYSWKNALVYTENNASADNAPVIICSDFPEADYAPMPMDSAKVSRLFSQLSYYKLTVPVVPLPRALNDEAMRVGSAFLKVAAQKHERFLALASEPSYKTLEWLEQNTATTYLVHKLVVLDGVEILEFVPRPKQAH